MTCCIIRYYGRNNFTVLLNEMYRCPYFTCYSTCSHLSGFYFDVLRNVSTANHFYGRFVIDGKFWTFLYVSIKLSSSRDYIWFILSLRLRHRGLIKSSSRQVKKNHVGGRRKKYNVIYVISKHLNHMHPNLIKLQIIIPVLIKLRSEDNLVVIFFDYLCHKEVIILLISRRKTRETLLWECSRKWK